MNMMTLKSINKVIRILILSDIFLLSALGFIVPIFAIFIADHIQGGDIKVAGFAVGIYWIGKSLLRLPIGAYLDKNHGEKDDFYSMLLGTFLISLVYFGYIFSRTVWHVYLLQGLYALGMAMAVAAWPAIFTRHIDQGQEAFEWGLWGASTGLLYGLAGILGGIIASYFGFKMLFVLVGILAFLAGLILIMIYHYLVPLDKKIPQRPKAKEPFVL